MSDKIKDSVILLAVVLVIAVVLVAMAEIFP
jgi:hypothetical protein